MLFSETQSPGLSVLCIRLCLQCSLSDLMRVRSDIREILERVWQVHRMQYRQI